MIVTSVALYMGYQGVELGCRKGEGIEVASSLTHLTDPIVSVVVAVTVVRVVGLGINTF